MKSKSEQSSVVKKRAILILDMSYTLKMFRERQLEQALESRKLQGYFHKVISVHPLAGLFEQGNSRFGCPLITELDDQHAFVEGKVGMNSVLRILPPLNFVIAQINLLRVLLRMAKEVDVDVVRVGDPYYLGLLGWVLSRFLRVPLAIRVNFNYDEHFKITKKAIFPRLFRFRAIEKLIEKFIFKRCDLVAGANKNNLEYGLANGAREETGVVFRYGNLIHPVHFSDPSIRQNGIPMLREIGISGEFLMTISRLTEMKQPSHNLFVLKRLREFGHDVNFLFVGDGEMREILEIKAKEMEIHHHVFFAGNRSQEWIAAVLPHARLVLSPHMGRALTEACLASAPVVAYDLDWQSEIIQSGETGELVPLGDWEQMALRSCELLGNSKKALRLGGSAREAAMCMMDAGMLIDTEKEAYETLFKNYL